MYEKTRMNKKKEHPWGCQHLKNLKVNRASYNLRSLIKFKYAIKPFSAPQNKIYIFKKLIQTLKENQFYNIFFIKHGYCEQSKELSKKLSNVIFLLCSN